MFIVEKTPDDIEKVSLQAAAARGLHSFLFLELAFYLC